jgi:hypothetical protein
MMVVMIFPASRADDRALTRATHGQRIGHDLLEGGRVMAWDLTGRYVETCSCELMCPCNLSFDHGATYDFCRVALVFTIQRGQVEGTDIAGRKVAIIADMPKIMTEGNWRLGVYIDDQASDEQLDKLVEVFSGQLGGPMGALAPLVGEVLGVERAAIEVNDDGLPHSVRVGDTIDFDIEDIVPFGVETGEPVRFKGCSTRLGRTSRWPKPSGRGSTRSASPTRARRASPSPHSPGPSDRDGGSAGERRRRGSGAGVRRRSHATRPRRGAVRRRRHRLGMDGERRCGCQACEPEDSPWSVAEL